MKIISVVGKSNSGKSAAIRYAMLHLISEYGFIVVYNSKKYSNNPKELLRNIKHDFRTHKGFIGQITCVGKIKDKKICITTYGDSYKYDILPAFNKGKELLGELDLFICASHGSGFDSLVSLVEKENVLRVCKPRSSNMDMQDKDNKAFGKELADRISDIVKTISCV